MKKNYIRFVTAFLGLTALGAAARGQVSDQLVVNIPYEFVAAGKTLPAGTYEGQVTSVLSGNPWGSGQGSWIDFVTMVDGGPVTFSGVLYFDHVVNPGPPPDRTTWEGWQQWRRSRRSFMPPAPRLSVAEYPALSARSRALRGTGRWLSRRLASRHARPAPIRADSPSVRGSARHGDR